ncbi:MAG: DUF2283 domain-containing protein [Elusimicrobia bacterium]|nr:DUF2283 domain-containing protein [Elusimicrobiota bacterium]MDE2238169.1 DUF2283 domain-containing protein [Elusimicrobiota bacterium]MDE2424388.1 DUF2283 domain-containing protein [Elusimicrobiota bacterium]
MRIAYDAGSGAAYIYLKEIGPNEVARTIAGEGEATGIQLDFDAGGRLIGIEVLDAAARLPREALR